MSLVENLINQISTKELGGITKPSGFDMDDDTFAKLLEKELNSKLEEPQLNILGSLGVPAGFFAQPMDGIEFAQDVQDQLEAIGEVKLTNDISAEPFEIKELDMGDFFSNMLKTNTNSSNSEFLNFAKKRATNSYQMFGKSFVSDLAEFVDDVASSI